MSWTDCYVNQRIECCRLLSKLVYTSDDRIVKIFLTGPNPMADVGERVFLK